MTTGGDRRATVREARRIVVKVGSSSLACAGAGVDEARIETLANALAASRAGGTEIVLVSSGAIASGLPPLKLRNRPRDLATQQAAASVGQGLLVHRYTEAFAKHGITVGQVLLTAEDVVRRAHYRNAQRTLYKLLEVGAFPLVNENDTVATEEIRFGDNDRLAALVAHLVHADLFVMLSDVDGLFDGNPLKGSARLISRVESDVDLANVQLGKRGAAGVGTGGDGDESRCGAHRHRSRNPRRPDVRRQRRGRARRRRRRNLVLLHRPSYAHEIAVAGPRGNPAWQRDPGCWRGEGGRRTPRLTAPGRDHRGRWIFRCGRSNRLSRRKRPHGGPRPGQL